MAVRDGDVGADAIFHLLPSVVKDDQKDTLLTASLLGLMLDLVILLAPL